MNDAPTIIDNPDEVIAEAEALDVGLVRSEDEATLYRYLRQRNRLASEIERVKENSESIISSLSSRLASLDNFYGPLAQGIVRRMIAGGKAKSVKTPFGMAGFRSVAARVQVTNEAAIPQELQRVKREPNLSAITEHFEKTGELPTGCELRPGEERFYAK